MNAPVPPSPPVVETADALQRRLATGAPGVVTVKPRVFFAKIEHAFVGPAPMNIYIPSSGIGSITMLEGAILVALLRLLQPRKVFEFGTFLGYSTALLLRNTESTCEVHSIDLGDVAERFSEAQAYSDAELHADDRKNDDYLRYTQGAKGAFYLTGLEPAEQTRVRLLRGDSTELDVPAKGYAGAFDLVFIDGGHDTATIGSDTGKALEMIGEDGVIVWHDFNSSIHSDVTDFVERLAAERTVLHVQSTMLAVLLAGDAGKRFLEFAVD